MSHRRIPVYEPDLSGNESLYVQQCLDSGWISSRGAFLERFEQAFAETIGTPHATSVHNGTVALHLALHCLGIGPGDEVIVPTFTYIASVNTIAQTGATPVFADSLEDTWMLDAADVERRITPRTKAVMAVHLYGGACDMDRLTALCDAAGLLLIEDCAEALGTRFNGRHVGTFGRAGTFSFFGNKTVTTGEGGMVTSDSADLHDALCLVKNQGMSRDRRYWHDRFGFNYRMTNLAAAVGLAQIERVAATLARKRRIAALYRAGLAGLPVRFQHFPDAVQSSEWLFSLLLPSADLRDGVMAACAEAGVETRPVFYCAHHMPMYTRAERFPVAERISALGISLPSFPKMSDDDVGYVCERLRQCLM